MLRASGRRQGSSFVRGGAVDDGAVCEREAQVVRTNRSLNGDRMVSDVRLLGKRTEDVSLCALTQNRQFTRVGGPSS